MLKILISLVIILLTSSPGLAVELHTPLEKSGWTSLTSHEQKPSYVIDLERTIQNENLTAGAVIVPVEGAV